MLFLFVGIAVTGQGLFGGRFLLLRDLQGYFYPWSVYKLRTIAAGEFPLWNPYSLFGQPFLANPQTGVLYALSYVYGLIPFSKGITVYVLVHLLIGAGGMYWFSRELGMGRPGAALAGLTYAFGGWMVKMWEFSSVLGTISWAPLFLVLIRRALKGKTAGLLLAGPAILATQVFAGYPMMVAFTVLAGSWLVLSSLVFPQGGRRQPLVVLGVLAAACASALVLSLLQLAPTAELAFHSPRVLSPDHAVGAKVFSLHPAELGNLLLPYLFGFPEWQKCFYIGLLPVMLAVLGLASAKGTVSRKQASTAMFLFACGLIVIGAVVSLGGHTPAYGFLAHVIKPFWSIFNWPSLCMFFVYVGTGLLAGVGLDALLSESDRRKALIICLIAGTFVLVAFVLYAHPQIIDILRSNYRMDVLAFRSPQISPARFSSMSVAGGFLAAAVVSAGALLLAGLAPLPRSLRVAVALAVVSIELCLFSLKQVFFSPENLYTQVPQVAARLQDDDELFRLARHPVAEFLNDLLYGNSSVEDFSSAAEMMRADTGLLYGIFRTYGWRSLASAEAQQMFASLGSANVDGRIRERLASLCNVKYLIDAQKDGTSFRTPLAIARHFMPRAFFIPRARWFRDPEEALQFMQSSEFDAGQEVLLLGDRRGEEQHLTAQEAVAAWVGDIRYTANTVTLRCKSDRPGFVFISDTVYPGWRAYLDGVATPIYRANYAFRAVEVPAGESEMAFVYKPGWFVPAAAATGAGWLILVACSVAGGLRLRAARRRPACSES